MTYFIVFYNKEEWEWVVLQTEDEDYAYKVFEDLAALPDWNMELRCTEEDLDTYVSYEVLRYDHSQFKENKTMFIDEVRKVMPGDTLLNQIKHNIIEIAKKGGYEYIINRPDKELELKDEIQWLKDNGFCVEEWDTRLSYEYYPAITVKW